MQKSRVIKLKELSKTIAANLVIQIESFTTPMKHLKLIS